MRNASKSILKESSSSAASSDKGVLPAEVSARAAHRKSLFAEAAANSAKSDAPQPRKSLFAEAAANSAKSDAPQSRKSLFAEAAASSGKSDAASSSPSVVRRPKAPRPTAGLRSGYSWRNDPGSLLEALPKLCIMRGSVLPRLLLPALLAAAVSAGLVLVGDLVFDLGPDGLESLLVNPYGHQIFALTVGFTIVMRVQLAYSRYWEALNQVYVMWSRLSDACTQCIAFDHMAIGEALEHAELFREQIVHLCSLLSALAMQSLQHREAYLDSIVPYELQYSRDAEGRFKGASMSAIERGKAVTGMQMEAKRPEVIGGLPDTERQLLMTGPYRRVDIVNSWILRCITLRQSQGGLCVPPPMLTRVFQELSNTMLGFKQARMVADTPFPFAFSQMALFQTIVMMVSIPIIVAAYTTRYSLAGVISAVCVAGFQSLLEIALELEAPFRGHYNQLPILERHREFNELLHALLQPHYIRSDYSIHFPDESSRTHSVCMSSEADKGTIANAASSTAPRQPPAAHSAAGPVSPAASSGSRKKVNLAGVYDVPSYAESRKSMSAKYFSDLQGQRLSLASRREAAQSIGAPSSMTVESL